ncbi:MAG: Mth938-like domain-containing protein [Bradyrhizobiaceae bacterium]|nr:Mth938-like domain-containing protein [Bradyrhizobiaceae bacterium]
MSHRGSIQILPSGIWAWLPRTAAEIDETSLSRVFEQRDDIDLFVLGIGADFSPLPEPLRWRLRDAGLRTEVLPTPAAASTYNVLFAEGRRVAAALIAVD